MSKELDYIADLERENRLLGERCNQLLKDKGELTDQIADIKANCDLAIEGRDVKIKELEEQVEDLKSDHEYNLGLMKGLNEKIAELNKANEWHYVKDGDLPKAYQKCYFIYSNTYGEDNKVIFSKYNINVLTGIYAFFLDEEIGEETTDPCFYDDINDDEIGLEEVYAWKEIVLPELKENENGKERT